MGQDKGPHVSGHGSEDMGQDKGPHVSGHGSEDMGQDKGPHVSGHGRGHGSGQMRGDDVSAFSFRCT